LLTSKKAHNDLNGSITMRTNNSNIYYLSKINKTKILNKTKQNLKQIFRRKSRDFIKEINSLEKISEQEKEKELSLKELFIKQNRKIFTKSKLFRNNSMMIKFYYHFNSYKLYRLEKNLYKNKRLIPSNKKSS
jgi:hypothetical protein